MPLLEWEEVDLGPFTPQGIVLRITRRAPPPHSPRAEGERERGPDGHPGEGDPIIEPEGEAGGDTIGLDLWPACHLLCLYLAAHPEVLQGAVTVELGGGVGAPGILAARLGEAHTVLLTDYDENVLRLLDTNVGRNLPGPSPGTYPCSCEVRKLDWRDPGGGGVPAAAASVVLASDVLYSTSLSSPFLAAVNHVLGPGVSGGCLLLSHTERRAVMMVEGRVVEEKEDSVLAGFLKASEADGLHTKELVGDDRGREGGYSSNSTAGSERVRLVGLSRDAEKLQRLPVMSVT